MDQTSMKAFVQFHDKKRELYEYNVCEKLGAKICYPLK